MTCEGGSEEVAFECKTKLRIGTVKAGPNMMWRRAIAVMALIVLPIQPAHGSPRARQPRQTQGGTSQGVPPATSRAEADGPEASEIGRADGAGKKEENPLLGGKRRPLYRLSKSDVVDVTFTFTPEFNQTATVQPDGRIALRRASAVVAEGKTAEELEQTIREAYAGVLHEPEVTVTLKEFDKPFFIASGEVGHPGKYELRSPTTVSEAVAMAGGFTPQAKHSQVVVFRHVTPEMVEARVVDVKRILKERDLSEDLALQAGDFLVVPKSLVSNVMRFMPTTSMGMFLTSGHF
jgi:polysaccharide biosynthesis/export protein